MFDCGLDMYTRLLSQWMTLNCFSRVSRLHTWRKASNCPASRVTRVNHLLLEGGYFLPETLCLFMMFPFFKARANLQTQREQPANELFQLTVLALGGGTPRISILLACGLSQLFPHFSSQTICPVPSTRNFMSLLDIKHSVLKTKWPYIHFKLFLISKVMFWKKKITTPSSLIFVAL